MFDLQRITTIAKAEEAATMASTLQTELARRVNVLEKLLNSSQNTNQELSYQLSLKDYAIQSFQSSLASGAITSEQAAMQIAAAQAAKDTLMSRGNNITEEGILLRSEKIETLNNHLAILETYLTELEAKKATLTA